MMTCPRGDSWLATGEAPAAGFQKALARLHETALRDGDGQRGLPAHAERPALAATSILPVHESLQSFPTGRAMPPSRHTELATREMDLDSLARMPDTNPRVRYRRRSKTTSR